MAVALSNCSSTPPPDPALPLHCPVQWPAPTHTLQMRKPQSYLIRGTIPLWSSIHPSYIPFFPTFPFSKPSLKMAVFSAVADVVRLPWIGLVLILISILGIAVQKYRTYLRLAHFQGPPGAAWTELWLARVTWQSRIHTTLRDVNEKYGTASGQSLLSNTSPPPLS